MIRKLSAVFSDIYRNNAWNGVESLSGPGSGEAATLRLRAGLVELVHDLGVRTVFDAACGDGYWMPDLPGYIGMDVAPEAIRIAKSRHPFRTYFVGDLTTTSLPRCDLVIFRDAMQHLSLRDGMAALSAIMDTRPQWLLASTYIGGVNEDIATGDAYSPDLEAEPFRLGEPARLLFDGYYYHHHDTEQVRDPRKHLGLWRL